MATPTAGVSSGGSLRRGLLPAFLVPVRACSSSQIPGWGRLCLQGKRDGICGGQGSWGGLGHVGSWGALVTCCGTGTRTGPLWWSASTTCRTTASVSAATSTRARSSSSSLSMSLSMPALTAGHWRSPASAWSCRTWVWSGGGHPLSSVGLLWGRSRAVGPQGCPIMSWLVAGPPGHGDGTHRPSPVP